MLRILLALIMATVLHGCASLPQADTREDALRQEAEYLGGLVKARKITKVQVADRLNIKRIELVGHNLYDDEVFAYYRHLAEERDRNRIGQAESQAKMKKKLEDVRSRYRQEPGKPGKKPVFTNFLMTLYGLPTL